MACRVVTQCQKQPVYDTRIIRAQEHVNRFKYNINVHKTFLKASMSIVLDHRKLRCMMDCEEQSSYELGDQYTTCGICI